MGYGYRGFGSGRYGEMTYEIRYNGRSGNITTQEFRDIAVDVESWVGGNASRRWRTISYDATQNQLRFGVSIVGLAQSALDGEIDTMVTGIQSINTTYSASFPTEQGITITPE